MLHRYEGLIGIAATTASDQLRQIFQFQFKATANDLQKKALTYNKIETTKQSRNTLTSNPKRPY